MIVVSSSIFPVPEMGQWNYTWPVKRYPVFKTIKQIPANNIGEVHISLTPYPIWVWDLDLSFMKGDATSPGANSPWHQIVGFYGQMRGAFQSWFYLDPYDNGMDSAGNLIINTIGTGDGNTISFQTTRSIGGMKDLVQNFKTVPNVFLDAVAVPQLGISPPASPSLSSVASGSLGAFTYYVKITYVTRSGETLPSSEASLAVGSNHVVKVASPIPVAGPLIGYNVYVATSTGAEKLQNASPIAIGTDWQEPDSGLVDLGTLPASNTTGWDIDAFGLLTFKAAPKASVQITWSGQFYFRCFFEEDQIPLQLDLYQIWSIKSLKFKSALR